MLGYCESASAHHGGCRLARSPDVGALRFGHLPSVAGERASSAETVELH